MAATKDDNEDAGDDVSATDVPKIEITSEASDQADDSVSPVNQPSNLEVYHDSKLGLDSNENLHDGSEDEEDQVEKLFTRQNERQHQQNDSSPAQASSALRTMHRFVLYETAPRFYLVGQDLLEKHFRVLKIDRTSPPGHLNIFEDENVYDRQTISELLTMIEDGNKGSGGFKVKCTCWGILGFIRFTESYYMNLITKRKQAAMVGGHYVYQIEATELIPLTRGSTSRFQRDRNPEEARYLGILLNLDLTKYFYFSYSYNITRSLQENISRQRSHANQNVMRKSCDWNDMFVWNHHLLAPAQNVLKYPYDWCLPIIHGCVEQSRLDVLGRPIYITIIARRSRFFAGARYLKRGANDRGFVANDVETEQIVSDAVTTSFHAPGPALFANPNYTSYVQHRGSIPLHWSQDNSGVTPKPDIDISPIDPFYSAAALHFDHLFKRYGAPIYVLNLIKARERTPRESKLLQEFYKAITFLNQSLPEDKKILYKAFDMSRAAKTRGQDVVGVLELIAEDILQQTDIFHNGDYETSQPRMQNGVARTNCIDCLDRTNAAQFVIGKRALGHQLEALGVIKDHSLQYDSDLVNSFTHMFHTHGDTIAIQYGGSHLAHTLSTYRKLNEWKNHSRDMVESFKRYYHNSFLDSQRQEAYNLFLGNYIYDQDAPMLWELPSDHYLHYQIPKDWWDKRVVPHYIRWFTPEHLEERKLPPCAPVEHKSWDIENIDNYWFEYYRPLKISSFGKLFAWRMTTQPQYSIDHSSSTDLTRNPSPFVPRKSPNPEHVDSPDRKSRKGQHVKIVEPLSDDTRSIRTVVSRRQTYNSPIEVLNDLAAHAQEVLVPPASADRSQWSLKEWWSNSLNPTVTEEDEYAAYLNHPLNLPLVVSNDVEFDKDSGAHADFAAYIARGVDSNKIADNGANTRLSTNTTSTITTRLEKHGDTEIDIDEENLADFYEFLAIQDNENPLTVTEEDSGRKRYKAYRQWLKGKSFFKQSKLDPEYRTN